MDDHEETLKPIRELLETIRERVNYAISRLKSFEEFALSAGGATLAVT